MPNEDKLTLIDLFAGSGGFGLGLEMAGFTPIYVNEIDPHARETYLINRDQQYPLLRSKYNSDDIRKVVGRYGSLDDLLQGFRRDYRLVAKNPVDLVVGGPPCQGFSTVGMRRTFKAERKSVPSNHLFMHMVRFIRKVRPRAFIFENVIGLMSARWTKAGRKGEVFEDVLGAFKSIPDYAVKFKLVYSKDYGVPQNRPRILIIGFRSDVFEGNSPSLDALEGGFLPQPSRGYPDLVDVLGDLVAPDFEYGGQTTSYPTAPMSEFQKRMRTDTRPCRVFRHVHLHEHEYSAHSERTQAKFRYMIANSGRIHAAYKTKKFRQRVLPKTWEETRGPTITITSLPDDFVHYEQPRSLTVRECARIQTFPDWYQFVGPRTTGGERRAGDPHDADFRRTLPRYTQIANAVPVDLATAIGKHIAGILRMSK